MSAKNHYDTHLGALYDWMVGDFQSEQAKQQGILQDLGIRKGENKNALDLGAGHGLQAISLANLGFEVTAVDFNQELLDSLKQRKGDLPIATVSADLSTFITTQKQFKLISCMGDTLAHLETQEDLHHFFINCRRILTKDGDLLLSFRDYSKAQAGEQQFIPVRSDDCRILTCVLNYEDHRVQVTDQLYEKIKDSWVQKVSSYWKLRIGLESVKAHLNNHGFTVVKEITVKGMHYLYSKKA